MLTVYRCNKTDARDARGTKDWIHQSQDLGRIQRIRTDLGIYYNRTLHNIFKIGETFSLAGLADKSLLYLVWLSRLTPECPKILRGPRSPLAKPEMMKA